MARTPEPWFREDRQAYFVTINGTRHNLGPDRKTADRRFHELMAQADDPPAPAPTIPPLPAAPLTVGQVFEKYLGWCEQHRSGRTYEWTRKHIQSFCDQGIRRQGMPAPAPRYTGSAGEHKCGPADLLRCSLSPTPPPPWPSPAR
jgi:hypothetical protein